MNNIGFLWFLLLILIIMVYYFIYLNDIRSLALLALTIMLLSIINDNMNVVLFLSLLLVTGFNLLGELNSDTPTIEYHIWSKKKYVQEEGLFLKEKTPVQSSFVIPNVSTGEDMQQMMYDWNKSRPSID